MTSSASLLPYAPLTQQIISGFHDVVHELGCGFSERVSQRAMAIALKDRGLLAEMEYQLTVEFRGHRIGTFEVDLLVERLIVVEVKATPKIEDWAKAQMLNYLRVAGGGIGFIANFGSHPEIKRFVAGNPYNSLPRVEKHPDASRWAAAVPL